jgi:hypothetical protein
MKSNLFRVVVFAALGFGNGYVWGNYIMTGVRMLFPEKESAPTFHVVVFDGWRT